MAEIANTMATIVLILKCLQSTTSFDKSPRDAIDDYPQWRRTIQITRHLLHARIFGKVKSIDEVAKDAFVADVAKGQLFR